MRVRNILLISLGIIIGIIYLAIANSIKSTELIWILTRANGLIAYILLCFVLLIGELKAMESNLGFRLHCSVSILTLYFSFMHFLSAVFDKFKWGRLLGFSDYLGFNFSDKWLALMSLGTLAFYLIVLISLTSSSKSIRAIGYAKWKAAHYLGYLVLTLVFIHSILLGTDLKASRLRDFLFPAFIFAYVLLIAILLLRLSIKSFKGKNGLVMICILAVLLSSAAVVFANSVRLQYLAIVDVSAQKNGLAQEINALSHEVDYFSKLTEYLQSEISRQRLISGGLLKKISEKASISTASIIQGSIADNSSNAEIGPDDSGIADSGTNASEKEYSEEMDAWEVEHE